MPKSKGFTLIEVLVVVTIIAILAAIIIPSLFSALQRAKQKRAMAEIRGYATACNAYSADSSRFPLGSPTWADTDVVIPVVELEPFYINQLPNPDPWGTKFQYASTDIAQDFGVRSLGKGGTADGGGDFTSLVNAPKSVTSCFENDIVWVGSDFTFVPENKQSTCL
jgi:general secretion pathway protein G